MKQNYNDASFITINILQIDSTPIICDGCCHKPGKAWMRKKIKNLIVQQLRQPVK